MFEALYSSRYVVVVIALVFAYGAFAGVVGASVVNRAWIYYAAGVISGIAVWSVVFFWAVYGFDIDLPEPKKDDSKKKG